MKNFIENKKQLSDLMYCEKGFNKKSETTYN
jgi:hypothetical protein